MVCPGLPPHQQKSVQINFTGKTLFRVKTNLLGWQKFEMKKNISQKNCGSKRSFVSKNNFWLKFIIGHQFLWYKKFGSRIFLVLLGFTLELGNPPPENSRVKGLNYLESYRFLSVKLACKALDIWDTWEFWDT